MAYSSSLKHNGIIQVQTGTDQHGNPVWTDLPDPQTLQFEVYDLDSEDGAGRDQQGLMFRDRRAIKEKLTCTFPPMLGQDLETMLALVKEPFFTARYYSPYVGAYRTATMYVGNRTSPMYYLHDPAHPDKSWYQATSMNLIER